MKFEYTQIDGFPAAFRGLRNPLNSWEKSDSYFEGAVDDFNQLIEPPGKYIIGPNDLRLAQTLLKAGAADAKFMRYINVSVDIVAPTYWLAELDTYKIATNRDSTSLQHKGMSRDYTFDDFTIDQIQLFPNEDNNTYADSYQDLKVILDIVNKYRQLYVQTKDYTYFRIMRQLIPMGYNYRITWSSNYAGLRNMYFQRRHHRLSEWSKDFASWVETLPYAKELIMFES